MLTTLSILSTTQGQLYPNKRTADVEPQPLAPTKKPVRSGLAKLLDIVHIAFHTPAARSIRLGM